MYIIEGVQLKIGPNTTTLHAGCDNFFGTEHTPSEFKFAGAKTEYAALSAILRRNGLLFDWVVAATNSGVKSQKFIAGVGNKTSPLMVWEHGSDGRSLYRNLFFSNGMEVDVDDFIALPPITQDFLLDKNSNIRDFSKGDLVKVKTSKGFYLGTITSSQFPNYQIKSPKRTTGNSLPKKVSHDMLAPISAEEVKRYLDTPHSIESLHHVDELFASAAVDVSHNGLVSLKGCPDTVHGNFDASCNFIYSFEYGPSIVHGDFNVSHNEICDLTHAPKVVSGAFNVTNNHIKSLYGFEIEVGSFDISNSRLYGIGGLIYAKKGVNFSGCSLTSIVNIHHSIKHCEILNLGNNPISEGWIYVFFIKGIKAINFNDNAVTKIFNKYLHLGKAGLVKCQLELMQNGFEQYAKL